MTNYLVHRYFSKSSCTLPWQHGRHATGTCRKQLTEPNVRCLLSLGILMIPLSDYFWSVLPQEAREGAPAALPPVLPHLRRRRRHPRLRLRRPRGDRGRQRRRQKVPLQIAPPRSQVSEIYLRVISPKFIKVPITICLGSPSGKIVGWVCLSSKREPSKSKSSQPKYPTANGPP